MKANVADNPPGHGPPHHAEALAVSGPRFQERSRRASAWEARRGSGGPTPAARAIAQAVTWHHPAQHGPGPVGGAHDVHSVSARTTTTRGRRAISPSHVGRSCHD